MDLFTATEKKKKLETDIISNKLYVNKLLTGDSFVSVKDALNNLLMLYDSKRDVDLFEQRVMNKILINIDGKEFTLFDLSIYINILSEKLNFMYSLYDKIKNTDIKAVVDSRIESMYSDYITLFKIYNTYVTNITSEES